MSDVIYLTLRGSAQGLISAGCSTEASVGNHYQLSHQDEIFVFALQSGMSRNRSGLSHNELLFRKALDRSTPLLAQAIDNNERLALMFCCYRINRVGRWEKYYQIELFNASIRSINVSSLKDNIDCEDISIAYDVIHCRHLIAGTEFYDLINVENYPRGPTPVTMIQPVSDPVKRRVTLTLGVFFDGSGNNAVNTRNMLEACSAQHFNLDDPDAVSILEQNAKLQLGLSGQGAISYKGYYTNIHWLNTLYRINMPPDADKAQNRIYIEGIGTRAGEPDSAIGLSLGIADTGVIAKTDDAIGQIAAAIETALEKLKGPFEIEALQFDVFGFSRGAAAARHFSNRIQQSDRAIENAVCAGMQKTRYYGEPAGKTRFIGLFDTVAAIGTPANGLNPHSANSGEVNLRLRPGVAERVFHITAGNECRFNFALNSVAPAWPELTLPGAHSDIGGGYLPQEREAVFITRPEVETVPHCQPGEQTHAFRRAMAQLHTLEKSPVIAPLIRNNPVIPEIWADDRVATDRYSQLQKRSFAALMLRDRIVRNDWSKVTLRAMLAAARAAGVVFDEIDGGNKALALPDDLVHLNEKVAGLVKSTRYHQTMNTFTAEELDALASHYIHCSANWNAVEVAGDGGIKGGAMPAAIVNFVNRPDEGWERTVYNMEGKRIWR